jgi:hypothetical protein
VAVGRYSNTLAAPDQVEDHLGADRRLPGTRRTLNRQVRVVESRCQQHRDILCSLAGLNQRRSFNHALDPRRLEAE